MNIKIYLLLLVNCFVVNSQNNDVAVEKIYKTLAKNGIDYKKFSDSIGLSQSYQKKRMQKADYLLLDISKSAKLKFKKFTFSDPNFQYYFRDSIFLFNKKYCIDNLLHEKKVLKKEIPLRLNYASGYTFSINSKKYISLFFWDSTIPTTNLSYYIILFDISDKNNVKPYFF